LTPAGYAVFSVNYRLAPKYPYPYMVQDVQRAVRFIRYNAAKWDADPDEIALVGGSAGGFLSNMVGLLNAAGDPSAADPVERVSARAQAVVSLYAQSSFEFVPLNADVHRLLDPLIAEKGKQRPFGRRLRSHTSQETTRHFWKSLATKMNTFRSPKRQICRRHSRKSVYVATLFEFLVGSMAPVVGTSCRMFQIGSGR